MGHTLPFTTEVLGGSHKALVLRKTPSPISLSKNLNALCFKILTTQYWLLKFSWRTLEILSPCLRVSLNVNGSFTWPYKIGPPGGYFALMTFHRGTFRCTDFKRNGKFAVGHVAIGNFSCETVLVSLSPVLSHSRIVTQTCKNVSEFFFAVPNLFREEHFSSWVN